MTKGIAIAQEGIDVDKAHDSQKVLDSRWRYFEIAEEIEISFGVVQSGGFSNGVHKIYEHKLGYLPAFDCYNITLGEYMSGNVAITGGAYGVYSTEDTILYESEAGDDYSNTKAILRIYNVKMTEEYQAPLEKTLPSKSSTVSSVGAKITTKRFRSTELSDFTLNTSGKSLAIQKTGVIISNASTGFLATITHNMGNPPTYLAAIISPTHKQITVINPDFMPVLATANGETLTFGGAQAVLLGSYAYIIFKELADLAI